MRTDRIKKQLIAILIVFILFLTLFSVNSTAVNSNVSNLEEDSFGGYIVQFIDEPLSVFKIRFKDRLKNVFSNLAETVSNRLLNENVTQHKEKLLSVQEDAKGDILEIDIPEHDKFISNIPYSITGPILEAIFFKSIPPEGILTIEKRLADRIFFKGDYKDFSRITLSVNSFMNPIKQTKISPNSFYPIPKIDLSLIQLNPKQDIDPFLKNDITKKFYLDFIAGIMPYKNKSVINAIDLYFKQKPEVNLAKGEIFDILTSVDSGNNKTFMHASEQLIEIAKELYNWIKIS